MERREWLAEQFEESRGHLRGVAYRMLGSLSEAEDAVQETWLRLNRSGAEGVENLRGWLTTVVGRVCLDQLRSRSVRREDPLEAPGTAEPVARKSSKADPEQEAILADTVGLALMVVLNRLSPAERLAFVLHDTFDLPFDQIAEILQRSPEAVRQLASRARRRVKGTEPLEGSDLARQKDMVARFLSALQNGDVEGLVAVLDPELVVRADAAAAVGGIEREVRGARTWASVAVGAARGARFARPALLDGAVGLVLAPKGRLFRALVFTFAGDRIATIEVVGDAERLERLELGVI